jgi:hypothetical protein
MEKNFLTGLTVILLSIGLVLAGCEGPTGADGSPGGGGPGDTILSGTVSEAAVNYALASGKPVVFAGAEVDNATPIIINRTVTLVANSPALTATGTVIIAGNITFGGSGKIAAEVLVAPQAVLDAVADPTTGTPVAASSGGTIVVDDSTAVLGNITISDDPTSATNLNTTDAESITTLYVIGTVTVNDAVETLGSILATGNVTLNALASGVGITSAGTITVTDGDQDGVLLANTVVLQGETEITALDVTANTLTTTNSGGVTITALDAGDVGVINGSGDVTITTLTAAADGTGALTYNGTAIGGLTITTATLADVATGTLTLNGSGKATIGTLTNNASGASTLIYSGTANAGLTITAATVAADSTTIALNINGTGKVTITTLTDVASASTFNKNGTGVLTVTSIFASGGSGLIIGGNGPITLEGGFTGTNDTTISNTAGVTFGAASTVALDKTLTVSGKLIVADELKVGGNNTGTTGIAISNSGIVEVVGADGVIALAADDTSATTIAITESGQLKVTGTAQASDTVTLKKATITAAANNGNGFTSVVITAGATPNITLAMVTQAPSLALAVGGSIETAGIGKVVIGTTTTTISGTGAWTASGQTITLTATDEGTDISSSATGILTASGTSPTITQANGSSAELGLGANVVIAIGTGTIVIKDGENAAKITLAAATSRISGVTAGADAGAVASNISGGIANATNTGNAQVIVADEVTYIQADGGDGASLDTSGTNTGDITITKDTVVAGT